MEIQQGGGGWTGVSFRCFVVSSVVLFPFLLSGIVIWPSKATGAYGIGLVGGSGRRRYGVSTLVFGALVRLSVGWDGFRLPLSLYLGEFKEVVIGNDGVAGRDTRLISILLSIYYLEPGVGMCFVCYEPGASEPKRRLSFTLVQQL
jgi:hypothetical protein